MRKLPCLVITLTILSIARNLCAQGTAFTYQGRLNDGNNPANGSYDLRFIGYDSGVGGSQQGPILTNSATSVSNGLFTVALDFGNQFPGASRWLEIAVRTNGAASFFTLSPRQPFTPAPYAITAGNVVSNGLSAGTYGSAVTFNNANNNFFGAFSGNGANVTNVNAAALGGLNSASFWKTAGNSGTSPTNGNFLGTMDNQPLELWVNTLRAMRYEPAGASALANDGVPSGAPNLIGGSPVNFVSPGVVGAVIAGGGAANYTGGSYPNSVGQFSDFAVIGGGFYNQIQSNAYVSTIGGGGGNHIQTNAYYSTIAGGYINWIQPNASFSTIGGGQGNNVSGVGGTVPGGIGNVAGSYSFAAGYRAGANHYGSFVWADPSGGDFADTANYQFLIRAGGGVGIGLNNPSAALHVASGLGSPQVQITQSNAADYARVRMGVTGSPTWEMDVSPGATPAISWWTGALRMNLDYNGNLTTSGTVNGTSDRNAKENFTAVSSCAVLEKVAALPITEWNFKNESAIRHLGPMAQDFYAAFGVGMDDRHIATVDEGGVALAAIQGLNQKLEEKDAKLQELETRLEKLEQLLNHQNPVIK